MRAAIAVLIVGLGSLVALPAGAQQGAVPQAPQPQPGVQIQVSRPPAEREARVVPPPLHYETTRPPDVDYYPHAEGGVKVEHDPAFIEPLAYKYETPNGSGRVGFSGWTSPNPPIGSPVSGWRDVSGYFALGFSVTWDGPPAPKSRPR
jgi:hypothetical protein